VRSGRFLRTFERNLLHADAESRAIDGRQLVNEHFLRTEALNAPETVTVYQAAQGCNTEDHTVLENSSGVEVNCTLMMEDVYTSETSLTIYHTGWCYNTVMIFAYVILYLVLSPV
jgi:hypothetical protein